MGFSVRLITSNELVENFEYVKFGDLQYKSNETVLSKYSWLGEYSYWTMSAYDDSSSNTLVHVISNSVTIPGSVAGTDARGYYVVRPVITLSKTAI